MLRKEVKVSLIIPTYNKSSRLRLVLESIFYLKDVDDLEIIIVNDGSTDDTEVVLRNFIERCSKAVIRVSVIMSNNKGRSYARNLGIKKASGSIIVFTDDDLILNPNFIHEHKKRHEENTHLVVHGQINHIPYLKFFKDPITGLMMNDQVTKKKLLDKTIQIVMFESDKIESYLKENAHISKFEQDIFDLYQQTTEEDSCFRWVGFNGGNVSIRKENILNAGMFDQRMGLLWGCEDLELGYRLYKEGYFFAYEMQAKNYHLDHYRKDSKEIHEESMRYFIEKHPDISIRLLNLYFRGEYSSLLEWKNQQRG